MSLAEIMIGKRSERKILVFLGIFPLGTTLKFIFTKTFWRTSATPSNNKPYF